MEINNQIKFLNNEVEIATSEFEQIFNSEALALWKKEEIYIGQFCGINKQGQLMVKLPKSKGFPRLGNLLWSFILPQNLVNFKHWGDKTYKNIVQSALCISDATCIWFNKFIEDDRFIIAGFNGIETSFYERLSEGCVIFFGTKEPPIDYYINIKHFLEQKGSTYNDLLSLEINESKWDPIITKNDSKFQKLVKNQLAIDDVVMIQGPPGTGKTTFISKFANELVKEGKSILITALANKALIEVAKSDGLKEALEKGKICKTKLTIDESKEIKDLKDIDEIRPVKGTIVLSTFYKTSRLLQSDDNYQLFDYLIVDEASQAFLGTIIGFKTLASKSIWIGDQEQLPPIVKTNEDILTKWNVSHFVKGFQNLCDNIIYAGYLFNESYRFGDRASHITGSFYNDKLKSISKRQFDYSIISKKHRKYFNTEGGHTLVSLNIPLGEDGVKELKPFLTGLCAELKSKNLEILVITPFRKTVKKLQGHFSDALDKQFNVETIDRIQGKTVDICILLIPNTNYYFSLNSNRFNVATSRARLNTLIIADKNISNKAYTAKVKYFLNKVNAVEY